MQWRTKDIASNNFIVSDPTYDIRFELNCIFRGFNTLAFLLLCGFKYSIRNDALMGIGIEMPMKPLWWCWDKLVWMFLISVLLGDTIETFWCSLVDGAWMNRSSVLYGSFGFVWGVGAVVWIKMIYPPMSKGSFGYGGNFQTVPNRLRHKT